MDISDTPSSLLLSALMQQGDNTPPPSAPAPSPASSVPPGTDTVDVSSEARILQQVLAPLVQSIFQNGGASESAVTTLLEAGMPDPLLAASPTGLATTAVSDMAPLLTEAIAAQTPEMSLLDQLAEGTDQAGNGGNQ